MEHNWKTESWKRLSVLEPHIRSLSRTNVHVYSDSVLCVGGQNAVAIDSWATEISEHFFQPPEFEDKYDLTARPVQFHWHIFSGHTGNPYAISPVATANLSRCTFTFTDLSHSQVFEPVHLHRP